MACYACADVSKIPYFGKDICVHANQIPPKRPPFSLTLVCSKKLKIVTDLNTIQTLCAVA